eukprot:GHRR01012804.1.p1 GENE.GHRR01012804.1~~GHRR01012804.1.p1  ORF type:complete len:125 (+),score=21.61 GHRR01012804.1:180-554(+)
MTCHTLSVTHVCKSKLAQLDAAAHHFSNLVKYPRHPLLQVKTIILCGHYNCGAVKAALQLPHTTPGLVNCWISDIRECRNQAEAELRGLDPEQQLARWDLGNVCSLLAGCHILVLCRIPSVLVS